MQNIRCLPVLLLFSLSLIACAAQPPAPAAPKTATLAADTPAPTRFVVRDGGIVDLRDGQRMLFRGIGYSPYLPDETPIYGDAPPDDARYAEHLPLMAGLGANYLHVFPLYMPAGFFAALDKTDMVYGQDIWMWAYAEDFLDPDYLKTTLDNIKAVIDHTYKVGRPDRLVLFSVGDELQPASIKRTDARHPQVRDFAGKHVTVSNRTPTEVALAMLIDAAIDYELTTYGRRHLYCHTSFTHVGPLDRPDIEVPFASAIRPDIGDLMCLNIYTYARGVVTSKPGSVTGTTYQGYLEDLAADVDLPIFITQVGLSTSPFEPKPWVPGFGGHRVEDVPKTYRAVWRDMRTAKGSEKFCGMAYFELNDEWWKSGEDPTDATRHERQDPEEWFGMYSIGKDRRLVPKGDIPATLREIFNAKE